MIVAALMLVLATTAPATRPTGELREAAGRQHRIAAEVREIAGEVDMVLAAYGAAGLAEDADVLSLREMRRELGAMSDGDMARIASLLETGEAGQARDAQGRALARLRALLADHQRRRGLAEMARRVRALTTREQAAYRATVDLSKTRGAKWWDRPGEDGLAAMQVLIDGQAGIAADAEGLGPASEALRAAGRELAAGRIFRAAEAQRDARDALRALGRALAGRRTREAVLTEAAEEIGALIAAQRDIAGRGVSLQGSEGDRPAGKALERREGDQGDLAGLVEGDLGPALPPAATDVRAAAGEIALAREGFWSIETGTPTPAGAAAPHIDAAVSRLAAARERIAAELARGGRAAEDAAQRLKQIEAAQAAVDKAVDAQSRASQAAEDAAHQPDAAPKVAEPAQRQAAEAARAAADEVNKASPEASREVGAASEAMEKAAQELDKGDVKSARQAQREAEGKLAGAQRSLGREADAARRESGVQPSAGAEASAQAASDGKAAAQQAEKSVDAGAMREAAAGTSDAAGALQKAAGRAQGADGEALGDAASDLREASAAARAGDRAAAKDALGRAERALDQAGQPAQAGGSAGGTPAPDSKNQGQAPGAQGATVSGGRPSGGPVAAGQAAGGTAGRISLPPRERAALEQSRGDAYPAEWGPLIEAYLKRLADGG